MKITTVLLMPEIEPSLDFWTERLGFEVIVTVPHGDKLGFAILQNDGAELMLQSHASAAQDSPDISGFSRAAKAALFIEVSDFDDLLRRIGGYPVAMPVRDTFYGMREIGVFEPGGNFAIFAWKIPQ